MWRPSVLKLGGQSETSGKERLAGEKSPPFLFGRREMEERKTNQAVRDVPARSGERIERAVLPGRAVRMIAGRFTVSPTSVERHKKNHRAGEMAAVLKEQSGQRMSWLMEEWHLLRSETVALDAELRDQKKPEARLKGLAVPEPHDRPGTKVGGTMPRIQVKQRRVPGGTGRDDRLMSEDHGIYGSCGVLEKGTRRRRRSADYRGTGTMVFGSA
jgi:hypothetical protein